MSCICSDVNSTPEVGRDADAPNVGIDGARQGESNDAALEVLHGALDLMGGEVTACA